MKAVSLFAGVGGMDLACQQAGIDVIATAEIDKHARAVLERRFPDTHHYDDVKKVSRDGLLRDVGALPDLVIGGFPCQDLSVAGLQAGLAGERSGLFFEHLRIAKECGARWVVFENVPGLLSSNRGRDMGVVLWSLGQCGYGFAYRVLDAQYFGVAQRRRRVFIVGCLGDDGSAPAEVLALAEGSLGHPAPSRKTRPATAGSVAAGVGDAGLPDVVSTLMGGGSRGYRVGAEEAAGGQIVVQPRSVALRGRDGGTTAELGDDQAYTLRAAQGGASAGYVLGAFGDVARTLTCGDRYDHETEDFVISAPEVAATLTRGSSGSPGVNPPGRRQEDDTNLVVTGVMGDIAHTLTSEGHDASEDGTGRGTPIVTYRKSKRAQTDQDDETWVEDHKTNTLNLFDTGDTRATTLIVDPIHEADDLTVRRLTPVEQERLQGFPDGWTEGQADSHRNRQMGQRRSCPLRRVDHAAARGRGRRPERRGGRGMTYSKACSPLWARGRMQSRPSSSSSWYQTAPHSLTNGLLAYNRRACCTTFETVVPSLFAFAFAASQTLSGTRTLRNGVPLVATSGDRHVEDGHVGVTQVLAVRPVEVVLERLTLRRQRPDERFDLPVGEAGDVDLHREGLRHGSDRLADEVGRADRQADRERLVALEGSVDHDALRVGLDDDVERPLGGVGLGDEVACGEFAGLAERAGGHRGLLASRCTHTLGVYPHPVKRQPRSTWNDAMSDSPHPRRTVRK